MNLVATKID